MNLAFGTQFEESLLVVGEVEKWRDSGQELPVAPSLHFAAFDEIDETLLDQIWPNIVVSPLVSDSFDAQELAERLYQLGFAGRYRVLSPDLPRAEVVYADISANAPGLDFALLELRDLDTHPGVYSAAEETASLNSL